MAEPFCCHSVVIINFSRARCRFDSRTQTHEISAALMMASLTILEAYHLWYLDNTEPSIFLSSSLFTFTLHSNDMDTIKMCQDHCTPIRTCGSTVAWPLSNDSLPELIRCIFSTVRTVKSHPFNTTAGNLSIMPHRVEQTVLSRQAMEMIRIHYRNSSFMIERLH